MQLSIIIINYNTFRITSTCIESVISHTTGLVYEIILVDNASSECSFEVFREKFPSLIVLPQQENLGFARGNNAGIKKATGEVVLLLNSDSLLFDNSILSAYQKLIGNSLIGALSAQLLYPDQRIQSCVQRFPSIKLELFELLRLQKILPLRQRAKLFLGYFFNHETEMEADWVWGTFFMFRRNILQGLPQKRLPDDFFMYGEDMQWCYEIKKMGYKIIYFPTAKVVHYLSASTSKNKNLNKQKMMIEHEYIFMRKYYGNPSAWLIFKLRSLKYWTLSWSDKNFKPFVALYAKIPKLP